MPTGTKSKLELDLERRQHNREESARRQKKAEEDRLEQERKERIRKFRADSKKLFKELFENVDVKLTDSTLEFEVKGSKYFISYDYYHIPKTPGDVDDYDISGYDWELRKDNRWSDDKVTIYTEEIYGDRKPRHDQYKQVLAGIEELNRPKRNSRW